MCIDPRSSWDQCTIDSNCYNYHDGTHTHSSLMLSASESRQVLG